MQLKNKRVVITGASSGIGKACAAQFAAAGADLIITARRRERLTALADTLTQKFGVRVLTLPLDIQKADAIEHALADCPKEFQAIDILVNNAGLALETQKIQDGKLENWDITIDTNVKGLLYMTRAILPGMITRNTGHILNIGSIAGRDCYPGGGVYAATKHAVRAISQSLRLDLFGTPLRVSEIAPGAVETEFSEVRWDDKARAKAFYADFTPLTADDIADAVLYAATRPAHVNVDEIVIMPTDQASITQIHRREQ